MVGEGVIVGIMEGTGESVAVGVAEGVSGVGVGISFGFGANKLQDANAMTRAKSNIALLMVFIDFLIFVSIFLRALNSD